MLFGALLCGVAAKTEANLLTNGSFELGLAIPSPDHYLPYSIGSTDLTGWKVIVGGIDTLDAWQATDGIVVVDLNGSPGPGGIEQSFATTIGLEYKVTFDLAGNTSGQFVPLRTVRVLAAGQFQDFSFDVTGHTMASMGWENKEWSFTAISTVTTLQFVSTFSRLPFEGVAIDNVAVNAVPEPTAAVLVIGAVVSSAVLLRRKK